MIPPDRFRPPCRKTLRLVRLLAAIVPILVGSEFLPAQSTSANSNAASSTQNLAEASLEDLLNIKVYSASRYSQPASEAPASVSVVTRDDIERYGYRTLADILRSVPGFYVDYDRLYSYAGVRGFANPGDYNTRVLLLVDGHRLNDSIFEQAMLGTEFPIDVDLIEKVEVIRGPASSLYGTNAVFAVINVITRTPRDLHGLEVSADAASFNSYRGRVSYGGTPHGISTVLSATFFDSKGHNQLFFPELNFPADNYGIARHADADHYTDLLATLAARGFTFQAIYGDREKHDPTGAWATVLGDPRNRVRDAHGYLDLRYQQVRGPWETMLRTYYDHYAEDGIYIDPLPPRSTMVNRDHGLGEQWGAEVQLSRNIAGRHKLTGGIEYRDQFRQELVNYDIDPKNIYLQLNQPFYVFAAYLQGAFRINSHLAFTAGLREDYVQRTGSSTNPRLALIFNPWQKTAFKLIYGTAFRSPNTYEMYYAAPGQNPSLGLRPEQIQAWEAAVEHHLTSKMSVTANLFYNHMANFIEYSGGSSGYGKFSNIPDVTSRGGELQLQGRWPNGIQFNASYSYQHAQAEGTGQWLVGSPQQLGKLNFSAPLVRETLLAGLEVLYVGKEQTLAGSEISDKAIVNLTLLSRRLPHHVEVSASAYNLLNTRYYDPAAQQHPENVLQQDGRSFRIKLTWRPRDE